MLRSALASLRAGQASHPLSNSLRALQVPSSSVLRRYFASDVTEDPVRKVLIANRGEIAVRVARTAKKMGVHTVAVYSDADANSMHVSMADEAVHIGPSPAIESYLRQDKILEVAHRMGADAIHPGYGFLSENSGFADACKNAGVKFVGPPSSAIRSMGSKSESKAIMEAAGVPVVPGYHGDNQDPAFLKEEAAKIGYPIMIKAVMGGGGKGMRIVNNEGEFDEALESAKREAKSSFDDDVVLLERYISKPRHVELQVFADQHGDAVYLFERDCSVQRRHQKVIEEAPAPNISQPTRLALGKAAVDAAKAVGYVGAGTVEFIFDPKDESFFFMEMNTRLQVEHPVTEMITGQDLVEWQLRIAGGERLPLTQEQLQVNGHSVEARIYAENPYGGFLPGTGTLTYCRTPEPSDTVRVETGVRQGDAVSVYYDPMIAKLVVWGPDRRQALRALYNNLGDYHIKGLTTNIPFLRDICSHPAFSRDQDPELHTDFIPDYEATLLNPPAPRDVDVALTTLALLFEENVHAEMSALNTNSEDIFSPWATASGARLNHRHQRTVEWNLGEDKHSVQVTYTGEPGVYDLVVGDLKVSARCSSQEDNQLVATIGDERFDVNYVLDGRELTLFSAGRTFTFEIPAPKHESQGVAMSKGSLTAPMPGKVTKVFAQPGAAVDEGDAMIVVEAMKMEHTIRAPFAGTVTAVNFGVDDMVTDKQPLVELKKEGEGDE
eukprot:TRINITY_DN9266_c0_g1_i1.p1 TRINITY_DN9266_c0_g1~~TRINITY_DN9266_c0_g1_i1.p1  ORF type:complete len:722 (-),score=224.94 TRINITY_DN9266_c0_g1_i1:117-2282(-)